MQPLGLSLDVDGEFFQERRSGFADGFWEWREGGAQSRFAEAAEALGLGQRDDEGAAGFFVLGGDGAEQTRQLQWANVGDAFNEHELLRAG